MFATSDAKAKLGGNPYDNSRRLYLGSGNDFWLNLLVDRYHADPAALAAIEADYQTSGKLAAPLVTLHTTADPIVPYWHEPLYSAEGARRTPGSFTRTCRSSATATAASEPRRPSSPSASSC